MRGLFYALLVMLLLLLALPLAAQDAESTEEAMLISPIVEVTEDASESPALEIPDVGGVVVPEVSEQLETLGVSLFRLIWNAAYLPFAVPMVAVATALSKRLPLAVSGATWQFSWTVILWVLYLVATQLGYAGQFQTAVESLATLGATFFGVTLTSVGAGKFYSYANKNNVAIIGYSRPAASETTGGSAPRPLTPIAESA